MNCRFCNTPLKHEFIDLGFAPPSNAYLEANELNKAEAFYPLKVLVCNKCWLVQTQDFLSAEKFFDQKYAYFSSTSETWLSHAKEYSDKICDELQLGGESLVLEIASNDGYLLKNFKEKNIPCLGVEPTLSTAECSQKLGIKTITEFFTFRLASSLTQKKLKADLVIANNVLAHVPDIVDFTKGLKQILNSNGTITIEFPHLLNLVDRKQFDTIYHEHFSYLSLFTVCKILKYTGLKVWKVEELETHGGSLRIYGCHDEETKRIDPSVAELIQRETEFGLQNLNIYSQFHIHAETIKNQLLKFLIKQKERGKTVVAYGAAAKGNTLLNYAGIKTDLISTVFDASLSKQNKYMPGSHIPIKGPDKLQKLTPDYVLILPWNISDEIKEQNHQLKERGTKFVTAIPEIIIHEELQRNNPKHNWNSRSRIR